MNREYALELIESRVDQYMNMPCELHRGFAMGLARFALQSNLITPDEYITYCDRMNEASYNVKNTFEEIAQALSPIVEHSKTINLWRYDLGARPSPALLDEISDSLEDALWILKSAIAAEKKNA